MLGVWLRWIPGAGIVVGIVVCSIVIVVDYYDCYTLLLLWCVELQLPYWFWWWTLLLMIRWLLIVIVVWLLTLLLNVVDYDCCYWWFPLTIVIDPDPDVDLLIAPLIRFGGVVTLLLFVVAVIYIRLDAFPRCPTTPLIYPLLAGRWWLLRLTATPVIVGVPSCWVRWFIDSVTDRTIVRNWRRCCWIPNWRHLQHCWIPIWLPHTLIWRFVLLPIWTLIDVVLLLVLLLSLTVFIVLWHCWFSCDCCYLFIDLMHCYWLLFITLLIDWPCDVIVDLLLLLIDWYLVGIIVTIRTFDGRGIVIVGDCCYCYWRLFDCIVIYLAHSPTFGIVLLLNIARRTFRPLTLLPATPFPFNCWPSTCWNSTWLLDVVDCYYWTWFVWIVVPRRCCSVVDWRLLFTTLLFLLYSAGLRYDCCAFTRCLPSYLLPRLTDCPFDWLLTLLPVPDVVVGDVRCTLVGDYCCWLTQPVYLTPSVNPIIVIGPVVVVAHPIDRDFPLFDWWFTLTPLTPTLLHLDPTARPEWPWATLLLLLPLCCYWSPTLLTNLPHFDLLWRWWRCDCWCSVEYPDVDWFVNVLLLLYCCYIDGDWPFPLHIYTWRVVTPCWHSYDCSMTALLVNLLLRYRLIDIVSDIYVVVTFIYYPVC